MWVMSSSSSSIWSLNTGASPGANPGANPKIARSRDDFPAPFAPPAAARLMPRTASIAL